MKTRLRWAHAVLNRQINALAATWVEIVYKGLGFPSEPAAFAFLQAPTRPVNFAAGASLGLVHRCLLMER